MLGSDPGLIDADILSRLLKLTKWLKDTVSIQVIVHKNEKDEDRKDK